MPDCTEAQNRLNAAVAALPGLLFSKATDEAAKVTADNNAEISDEQAALGVIEVAEAQEALEECQNEEE